MKSRQVDITSKTTTRLSQVTLSSNREAILRELEKIRTKDPKRASYLEQIATILNIGDRVHVVIYAGKKSISKTGVIVGYQGNRRGIELLIQPDGANKDHLLVSLEAKGIEHAMKTDLVIKGNVIQIIPEFIEGFLEGTGNDENHLTRIIRKIG